MVKNSFIEKTYVVGPQRGNSNVYLQHTENKEENYLERKFPSIMSIVLTSFKHPKLPISIEIPVTLLQIVYICMTATRISPNSTS